MAATDRLSASDQTALILACTAFSNATQRFDAKPGPGTLPLPDLAVVHFMVSGKRFDMPAVVVARPGSVGLSVHDRLQATLGPRAGRRLMLVSNHVSPKVAKDLIAKRIPFMDTAGNAYIDEPEATVMIVGRDKPTLKHTDTTSRSTTPKGLIVSFALATQPDLVAQPFRTIAQESGVALNTVNLAVDDLIARGLIVKKGGRRVIADPQRFIEEWVSQYPARLRTKLGARRFTSGRDTSWWQGPDFSALGARLGGEVAADVLTHEIKAASVTVYANSLEASALMQLARLRPDPHGAVEILEPFWPEPVEESWGVPQGIVHPLLIYADLIASCDSRNSAVAQTLHERYLAS